ncbi:hypothetical protein HYH03_011202 [Edaphochlamys debaryana]|uniref:U-box domain-containing protein n=1 Tax=Edaphochlamys debaryana TaxID=47281 RepID=A0A835XVK8_9CHLO|nr:hypothetical protein HYH03_011202 [Edaphochlamys debaryana]|eukprot:KAG2490402.1 hypothetical protein HYH03_011202 [Edaphochlamys debaryana]
MGNYTSSAGTSSGFTPSDAFFLTEATRSGSLDIIRLFLKKNPALVYAANPDKSTPWHVASASGHDVVLRVLIDTARAQALSNTFDPLSKVINKQNDKGQTPLMLACGGGHSVCVRLLLESGAHLLVADAGGLSALHYAASHNGGPDGKGNDCVELLLAHMQQQLLLTAPDNPEVHSNIIRKFVDAGDLYGRTALHYAAWSGNAAAAHCLWAAGADICARTEADCYDSELPCNAGTTPLHFAAMRGNQAVVVLLLAAWHRMMTRPKAPLPRASYSRVPPAAGPDPAAPTGGEGSPGAGGRSASGEGGEGKEQQPGASGAADGAAKEGGEPGKEGAGASEGGEGVGKEGKGEAGGGAGASGGGAGATEAGGGEAAAAARPPSSAASDGPSTSGGGASAAAAANPRASSNGGGSAGRLPPRPPSPRLPPADPRLMTDAYGMTPYSIARKRCTEIASMLIELLDPSTNFAAGDNLDERPLGLPNAPGSSQDLVTRNPGEGSDEEHDSDDPEHAATSLLRPRGLVARQRFNSRRHDGSASDGDDSDSDDSDDGAAGAPLLLWEGVELIQGIASDPDSFFTLQQTAALLQQTAARQQAEARSSASGQGKRASGSGGRHGHGQGHGQGRRSTTTVLEEVPDCFLCPLTCEVFRDPVVAADGVTYEREAIEKHLRHVPTSPVTKQRLPYTHVYPNTALVRAIEHWRATQGAGAGGAAGGSGAHTSTGLAGRR